MQSDAVDVRYISQQDTSATLNAVAAGINPKYDFIPDTFNCYDEEDNHYGSPDLVVQIAANNTYATNEGSGRFALKEGEQPPSNYYQFDGGPFGGDFFYLQFNNFGQAFNVDYGSSELNCFQAGAREEQELTQFVLNTPVEGEYSCRDVATGNSIAFVLFANNQYQIGGQTGNLIVTSITSRSASRFDFESGPLAGERAWYREEAESGYRSFSMSTTDHFGLGLNSTSQLSMICESFGTPVSFKEYGASPAPALPTPAHSLSGLYYQDNIVTTAQYSDFYSRFYFFEPGGYVHEGTPHTSGIDCSRTKPNGLPYCNAYNLQGNEIQIYSTAGLIDTLPIETNGNSVASINSETTYPVQATPAGFIVGNWESLSFYQVGCLGASCSSSFTEYDFTFSGDGRFVKNTKSESYNSLETAISTSTVSGFSDSSLVGQYSVTGNQLQLTYDNGRTTRHFVYLPREGFLAIDNLLYLPDRD
ncbi:MAG: hypothetical protein V3U76_17340 [Granulosicoccus sp.]